MTWHADTTLLDRYSANALDDAQALSVEAHLITCEQCRRTVSAHAAAQRLDGVWTEIVDRLDAPQPSAVERFLLAVGVPDHTARVLAATPALSASWLAGVAATLGFVALSGGLTGDVRAVALFLIIAPVLPVVGVAISYGPRLDPVAEVAAAAAMDSFRLLLVRALAVVSVTSVLTGLAALVLPAGGWTAVAWLLPSLALTSATLALGRWVQLQVSASMLVATWMVATLTTTTPFRLRDDRLFIAFESSGQLVSLVVAAVCALLLWRSAGAAVHVTTR